MKVNNKNSREEERFFRISPDGQKFKNKLTFSDFSVMISDRLKHSNERN